jgi:hypothetical protein
MSWHFARSQLAALYEFWGQLRGSRRMPSRRDIDVCTLRPWLGNLGLLSVINDGEDYFVEVHGTNLGVVLGEDLTGQFVKARPYAWVGILVAEYDTVVRTRAPLFTGRRPCVSKRYIAIEKLILPLSANDRDVDMILYGAYEIA